MSEHLKMQSQCDDCGVTFSRADNQIHHCNSKKVSSRSFIRKRKVDTEQLSQSLKKDRGEEASQPTLNDEIPCFDGDEFCGNKPLTRKTLYRLMKHLKIPEEKWSKIATEELKRHDVK